MAERWDEKKHADRNGPNGGRGQERPWYRGGMDRDQDYQRGDAQRGGFAGGNNFGYYGGGYGGGGYGGGSYGSGATGGDERRFSSGGYQSGQGSYEGRHSGRDVSRDWNEDFERSHQERGGAYGYGRGPSHHPGMMERMGQRVGRFFGMGPAGFKKSDARLEEQICERLTEAWDIDATNVTVKVADGEVTLAGFVASRQEKRLAEDLVEEIWGVKEVLNQLRLRPDDRPEARTQTGASGTMSAPEAGSPQG